MITVKARNAINRLNCLMLALPIPVPYMDMRNDWCVVDEKRRHKDNDIV